MARRVERMRCLPSRVCRPVVMLGRRTPRISASASCVRSSRRQPRRWVACSSQRASRSTIVARPLYDAVSARWRSAVPTWWRRWRRRPASASARRSKVLARDAPRAARRLHAAHGRGKCCRRAGCRAPSCRRSQCLRLRCASPPSCRQRSRSGLRLESRRGQLAGLQCPGPHRDAARPARCRLRGRPSPRPWSESRMALAKIGSAGAGPAAGAQPTRSRRADFNATGTKGLVR